MDAKIIREGKNFLENRRKLSARRQHLSQIPQLLGMFDLACFFKTVSKQFIYVTFFYVFLIKQKRGFSKFRK